MTTELWRHWTVGGVGELGYALELLLGAITVVIGCVGVVLCLMGANGNPETAFIERGCGAADEDRPLNETAPSGQVTIRLESGFSRIFRRQRCVVTIREAVKGASETDHEVWYAKDRG